MPSPENPITTEVPDGPIISETLQQTGVRPAPTNVTQVNDTKGNPIITTPATNSAKIQIPSDRSSLLKKAKGSIGDAATWLARFFLRLAKKEKYANNNDQ